MALIQLFAIPLQANNTETQQNIEQLDGSILIPAFCIILVLIIVASISIASQKYKQ